MDLKKRFAAIAAGALLCFGVIMPATAYADISDDNKSDIESSINALIEKHEAQTPSVAITVFDDTGDICSVIYGSADRENGVVADEDTVYEWGSVTKTLVWTSAMQLYERGELDLNEDIRPLLPDHFLKKLKYDEPITMLELMNHSAGFSSSYKDPETAASDEIMPLEKALRELEPAQVYRPGEVVSYSNYGAALAGYVVERVSGMDFADYVKENIFDRLGMEHTAIRPDLSDNARVAAQRGKTHCYAAGENGLVPLGECRRYIHIFPAGSACGTISDLALFARSFLCDSKDCPLFDKDETLDEMLTPSLYYADGETPRGCHGLKTEIAGTLLFGHGGNTEGFTSLMQFDPVGKTGFVMMTNKRADRAYRGELTEVLYGSFNAASAAVDGFDEYDLSGYYVMTGGMFESGCLGIYGFLNDRLHIKNINGEYSSGKNGIASITQISDNVAVVKLITGSESLYFIRAEDGKLKALENSSLDFVKISDFEYYRGWAIFILMLAGMAFLTVMAGIHFARLKKHKGGELYKIKLAEALTGAFAALTAVAVKLLKEFGLASYAARAVICVSIGVFSAALAVGILIANLRAIRARLGRGGRCLLIAESLCAVFIVVGVVYWRLVQFSC